MPAAQRSFNAEGSGGFGGVVPPGADADAADLPVRPGEDPWTDAELKEVRAELESEAVTLHADLAKAASDIAERLTDAVHDAGDDQADAGTKAFEREQDLALTQNARDLLDQGELLLTLEGLGPGLRLVIAGVPGRVDEPVGDVSGGFGDVRTQAGGLGLKLGTYFREFRGGPGLLPRPDRKIGGVRPRSCGHAASIQDEKSSHRRISRGATRGKPGVQLL